MSEYSVPAGDQVREQSPIQGKFDHLFKQCSELHAILHDLETNIGHIGQLGPREAGKGSEREVPRNIIDNMHELSYTLGERIEYAAWLSEQLKNFV